MNIEMKKLQMSDNGKSKKNLDRFYIEITFTLKHFHKKDIKKS